MELRTLGDYHLHKQLGYGSLGTSFLAEHRFTKQLFVLKILPEELATDSGFIRRFEEEVRLLATLSHPGLVKLHTVSHAQSRYFLITDAVVNPSRESTNLAQYMLTRNRRLAEPVLYDLLLQIAEALDYAHGVAVPSGQSAMIHRGLKLNNILVLPGEEGKLKIQLTDFGLSRIIGAGAALTQIFRTVAATLEAQPAQSRRYPHPPMDREQQQHLHASFLQAYAFLAPEQKRTDRPDKLTAAVDAFAFGILAYTLIKGEAPEMGYPFPSAKVDEYYWNWNALIQSCLQRDPAERPASLVAALKQVQVPEVKKEAPVVAPAHLSAEANQRSAAASTYLVKASTLASARMATAPASAPAMDESAMGSKEHPAPVLRPAQLQRPQVDLDPARSFQIDTAVTPYTPQISEMKEVQPLLTDMIVISEGAYLRGSTSGNRDENPRHQVTVKSFAIDVHPVTNEQFVRFLDVMGGEKDNHHRDLIRLRDARIKRSGGRLNIESGYQKHPVVGVTWYGALLYAQWVGKRLPTEVEWEIAASGAGENLLYPTGETIEKNQANFFSSDTTAVMSYPPTELGLYDMAGNVYEWCHDWYAYNYYEISVQEPENPQGPLQGVYRVLRGGCWKSLKEDLRCARRHRNNPGTVNSTYGFRCAADVS